MQEESRNVSLLQFFHMGFEVCPLCTGALSKMMRPTSEFDYTLRSCRNQKEWSSTTVLNIPWPPYCDVSLRKIKSYFTNNDSPFFFIFLLILFSASLQNSYLPPLVITSCDSIPRSSPHLKLANPVTLTHHQTLPTLDDCLLNSIVVWDMTPCNW